MRLRISRRKLMEHLLGISLVLSFVLPASLVYKRNRTLKGAIIGLVLFIVLTALLFALGIGVGVFGLAEGMANGEIDLSELGDYLGQNISTTVNTLNL